MKRFGAYEILHELSSGGMGSVLLGRRRGPGAFEQLVAIKTIRPEFANAQAVRAMFLDEAAILARINHPGIATVHDFGEEAGTLYMVMEYVAGTSVRGLVDSKLPPPIAARLIAEAARGLHAAHEARDNHGSLLGLVHRDISPDNLMLGFDGHVKVIDFGIALVKNRQAPVTEFGTVKGKPPYMSPEQVKNEAMDRRSDVFSLAVVLHELLTGEGLFDGDSIYAVARAVEHQEIRPPSAVLGRPLPFGLDAAVMNALERHVDRRTPTAAQLAEELERVVANAGDETLAAWADRELAEPRAAHRAWLSGVLSGTDGSARVGRATGAITHVGPIAEAPPATPAMPEPEVSTHVPANVGVESDSALDRVPRRSLGVPLLVALLAIGGVITALLVTRKSTTSVSDASVPLDGGGRDAALDATPDAPVDVPVDAPEAPTIDAAVLVPVDAGARRVPTDAGRSVPAAPPDAAAAPPPVDAAEKPAGQGVLNIRNKPGGPYLNVVIDGRTLGVTPILRKLFPAGTHRLQLLAPDTGEIVFERSFDLAPGATLDLREP